MSTLAIPHQRGLSMVELLVALAISSFLLLGITQIYVDNKRNFLFQQSQASNQEGSRFATLLLNEYLGKAGFRRTPDQLIEDAFPAITASNDCKAFLKGSAVTPAKDAQGICLRYQPLVSGELDCQGDASKAFDDSQAFKAASSGSLITIALRYKANADLSKGVLECKNLNATTPAYQELLSGIADLRLEFGVGGADMLEKALADSNRFIKASDWSTSSGQVRAVRYSILLASGTNQRDGDSKLYTDWYNAADSTTKTRLAAGDSKRIYQIASSTQTLRNLMP